MQKAKEYHARISQVFDAIMANEAESIRAGAELLAQTVQEGRLINIFGAGGHSAIAAMEIFWRAGGLVQVNAMFPPGTNIVNSYPTYAKITGAAPFILNFYEVGKGDTLILVNFYGLNPVSVDVAIEAKRRGVKLITVNAHKFAERVPRDFKWRLPEKKNINDFADIAIDNHVPYPDAVLEHPKVSVPFAPTATLATCFTLNCLMSETIVKLAERGISPDLWISNNIPGCDEHNTPYIEKYRHRIHHLYPAT